MNTSSPCFVRLAVGAALAATVLCTLPASAADVPAITNRYAATIVPAERFEVGGVLVERHGAATGRPLVFIPGLASGSWAWQDAVRVFAPKHPVYVLTLPGFDGRPAAGPAPFAAAKAAVKQLLAQRHLDRPVLVGHSLGGILALALAEEQPASIAGVVSIDGLPVMPGTEEMTLDERARFAQTMGAQVSKQPPDRFAAQQQTYMRTIGSIDIGRADELAKLSARSDPASVGRYAAEVLTVDLRPALASITAPVLVVMPFLGLDSDQQGQTEEAKLDYYRTLMAGTPKLKVVPVAPSRHFAMFDQPQAVDEAIETFLKSL